MFRKIDHVFQNRTKTKLTKSAKENLHLNENKNITQSQERRSAIMMLGHRCYTEWPGFVSPVISLRLLSLLFTYISGGTILRMIPASPYLPF